MGLTRYREKRNFRQTPEPTGGKPDREVLRFVIQKHAASHLHYDFRLEMDGVLKSWAIPKGPSLDPEIKRLAMMVEDHPYDYRTFEGIIPQGYGAGTVIVWDEGTYEAIGLEGHDKKKHEKELMKQLHAGSLKFRLNGKKLKGEFALVKTKWRGENSWLLIKHKDQYASKEDITEKDRSVLSKKTIEQIAEKSTNFYGNENAKKRSGDKSLEQLARKTALNSVRRAARRELGLKGLQPEEAEEKAAPGKKTASGKAAAKAKTAPVKKTGAKKAAVKKKARSAKKEPEAAPPGTRSEGRPSAFPSRLTPMLATLVDQAPEEEGWIYEVKWDGYRALAFKNGDSVELRSRNDKSFNEKFYPVYDAVQQLPFDAVIDGEIVVLGEKGISDFGALQNWRSEADGELVFYVFDLPWLNGRDLSQLPLTERKKILEETIPESDLIRVSKSFEESGREFFAIAKKMGLEGIIAKRADSLYLPGKRTTDWLKIKAARRQEVVIGGYTQNEDSNKPFSSLLVGVFDNGRLVYTGKIGTGFNRKTQLEMMKQFKPLIIKRPPFTFEPDVNKPSRFRPNPPKAVATWLKPELVCEVSYTEMTSDGVMRHPSFEGMRSDKKAADVVLEEPVPTEKAVHGSRKLAERKIIIPGGKRPRKTLLNPTEETQVKIINGHELKFTNLSKVFWPEEHVTKRDMINYYYQVAPFILPYLKDRPQTLNRHPHGIHGESFYQKDVTGKAPDWIEKFLYHSEADHRDKHFLVATNEASLLYMASLGCIELNPWSSRVQRPGHPDWCIIDLDPETQSFDQVVEAAQVTKAVLDKLGVPSYCKTSGSTGLHIYIPLGAKYTYEQSREFGRVIATLVHREIPEFTSIERIRSNRKKKMYIDFLQNRPQATLAGPYSLRPKPGAPVSMPLHWDEVKKGIRITDYNIFNAMDRLRSTGDIFRPVLGKGIDLRKVMKRLG